MALPGLMSTEGIPGGIAGAGALFEKVPDRLFSPLASQNRRTYWRVICRLYADFYGPDVSAPPIDGYPQRVIQHAIEDELSHIDDWTLEEDQTPDTPLTTRANQLMKRLAAAGWLILSTRGAREYVSMRTEVLSFTGALLAFALAEPVFFSAKVNSIKSLLESVYAGVGEGDQLNEAAAQARQLIEYIRHMIGAVAALESIFRETKTTADFVRAFFDKFIETHFIGDYRELRTRDHPLSERNRIVQMAEDIQAIDTHRERLLEWYRTKRGSGNASQAERLFYRDISRLLDFNRIDEYLGRLDDEVRRVNQRALATLDYKLRSTQQLDHLLNWAIRSIMASPDALSATPFAPGELISGERLASPRRRPVTHAATPLRDTVISEEERAKASLRLRAREARTLTAPELANFVRQHLGEADTVEGNALTVDTIKDVRALQTLMTLAFTSSLNSPRLEQVTRAMTRGFRVRQIDIRPVSGLFLSGAPFRIERLRPRNSSEEGTKK